jgi:transposase
MARPSSYSPELRARAVRMVAELTPDYPSQYAAITAVAETRRLQRQRAWWRRRSRRGDR